MTWRDHIQLDEHQKPILRRGSGAIHEVFRSLATGGATQLDAAQMLACYDYVAENLPKQLSKGSSDTAGLVHASSEQLAKAFRHHCVNARTLNEHTNSQLLLFIYAIECGLKHLLLNKRGQKTTVKLSPDDRTHDLNSLLKSVGSIPRFDAIQVTRPDEKIPAKRFQEALRYGRPIEKESLKKLVSSIGLVTNWIEEQIQ